LDFCKQNGFQTAHIWACPPGEGDDYIFHCHPIEQKIPKPKRLVEWYRNMLERGREHNVISSYVDVFQYCTEVEITAVTEIPYFEGDFWPNVIEETIKELDQEAEERKAVEATVDNGSKKAGKRSTSKKGSKKAASRTKISRKVNPLVNGDDLTQKIYQTMDKHKEVFFVVYLQPPSLRSSPLPSTTDPDSLVTCDLMDGRDAFLNLAREKHWEFSSLRRAKYSTMSMLYELFNQGDRFVYTCNNCHTDVEFRYHCTECEDYDLCESCYKVVRHEHPMEKLGFNMGDVDSNSSSKNAPLTREQRNKKRNEFLIHACQCRDPSCSKPLCIKMKQLLRHARDCKMRLTGKCTACNFFIRTCALHAQECRETKCPVPICANLKQKIRERRLREKTRSMQTVKRRMAKMNQTTTSPPAPEEGTKPDPSPSTPQPIAAAPTPGKNVSSPNPNPNTPSQPAIPASPAPLTNPGTPFVPNTPQAKPVESPAPMPQQYNPQPQQQVDFNVQIQRIINALCSPSPQENLKAKEYLRGHPNIVPFVVSGLQKQNKEQEALYLRQEFAGILMARNNAAPVPGPAYRSRPPMPVHHQPPMMNHPGHYYPNQPPQRMMYAPGGGAGHSLHHMLQQQPPQRPMHQNPYGYGMPQGVHPNPPQYQMKPPSRTMMMYSHQNMMPPGQQQMNPAAAMMQQRPPMMNMHQGGVMGATPMRGLSMHQYRPPMEHQMVDPMMHYQYSGGPGNANNSNSNNNNISPSSGNPSSASISHQQYYISGKNFHHQM
jgi:E1A/CREB-binding protein